MSVNRKTKFPVIYGKISYRSYSSLDIRSLTKWLGGQIASLRRWVEPFLFYYSEEEG